MTNRPIHVLLIEDNPGDIRLVRELFAQTGNGQFTLTHVGRLDAGIRCLSESLIDVILLDLSLPDSQGIETLIRMHAAAHGIPIVLMTGLEDEELGLHLIQAGAQDYLIKGQTSAPLLARALRYAVGRKRLEEELREQTRFLQSVLNSMADGVVMADETGTFRVWNPAAEQILGSGPAKRTVGHWSEDFTIFRPDRVTPYPAEDIPLARAIRGESVTGSTLFLKRRSQGNDLWLDVSARPLRDEMGLIKGGVVVFRDITEARRTDEALRDSENRFRAIMDNSPALIFLKDLEGRYLQANRQFETVSHLANKDLVGKTDEEIFAPAQAAVFRENDRKVLKADAPMQFEESALHDDGPHTSIVVKFPLRNAEGRCYALCGIATDITDKQRAEEIRQQLAKDRLLLLESTGEGIYGLDRQGRCTFINSAASRMLGYSPDELLCQDMHERIHHSSPDGGIYHRTRCHIHETLVDGRGRKVDDEVYWRKDRTSFPVEYSSFPVIEQGKVTGAVVVFLDITDRKRAEQQLTASHAQLRKLTARLESVREEERILIAREIHDELGQALTGVKLELSLLQDQLPSVPPTVHSRLESISGLVDATIQSVRRIATDLRPIVLDQLGLIPAIEWQTHEFQSRTGIECRLDIYLRSACLSQTASTAMFRIFQEILTNVVRHAKASVVKITLQEQGGGLVLEVQDNGRGITETELADPQSLGLVGMRERALLLGGSITFAGNAGSGTIVRVRIPLDQPAEE
ncbi:MAG: PAS domain S-box protein [Nitrospira sp.]|nr:PAS domain S-box protein [Nitrospira sp.]